MIAILIFSRIELTINVLGTWHECLVGLSAHHKASVNTEQHKQKESWIQLHSDWVSKPRSLFNMFRTRALMRYNP